MVRENDLTEFLFNLISSINIDISGGIYKDDERPDNSKKEDIVIKYLAVTYINPQTGTSIINVHVPDKIVKIENQKQLKADYERLRQIVDKIFNCIQSATLDGATMEVSNITYFKENNEHFANIRVNWIIYNKELKLLTI